MKYVICGILLFFAVHIIAILRVSKRSAPPFSGGKDPEATTDRSSLSGDELVTERSSAAGKTLLRDGAASKDRSARLAHNQEVGGSNPSPATIGSVVQKTEQSPTLSETRRSSVPPVSERDARLVGSAATNSPTDSRLVARPAHRGSVQRHSSDVICAWCQREQAIAAQPGESHGICQRHKEMVIREAKRLSLKDFLQVQTS